MNLLPFYGALGLLSTAVPCLGFAVGFRIVRKALS